MFSLQNRGELTPATETEFEGLFGRIRRFLLAEHKEDGSHANLTADGLVLTVNNTTDSTGGVDMEGDANVGGNVNVDGTISADGNITADADGTPVEIGNMLAAGTGSASSGIRMTAASNLADWIMTSDFGVFTKPALVFADVLNINAASTIFGFFRSSAVAALPAVYNMAPTVSTVDLNIGVDAVGQKCNEGNFKSFVKAAAGFYERLRNLAVGEWAAPAFNAGDFTSVGGGTAWTVAGGNVATYKYTLVGKTMTVAFKIDGTNVTGAPSDLQIKIPAAQTSAADMVNLVQVQDAGAAWAVGVARVIAGGGTTILIQSAIGGAGWTATAGNNTSVRGEITFEVS